MVWIACGPLLLLLVLFGLSNRREVEIFLWPLDIAWVAPLSVAVLVAASLAFLFGALIAWTAAFPHRRRARRLEATARGMEAELADLRARAAREVGPVQAAARPGSGVVRLHRSAA
jgi:uncharacterized integral membrane protein